MQFKVLGPVEAWDGDRLLELGPRMPRAVLALLLLHPGRVVSLDRLIDELWGDRPPGSATTALQVYVSHLRKVLEPARAPRTPPQVLITKPPGYLLQVEGSSVDAVRFETLATEGREALAAGDAESARDAFRRGLALWRGSPYADLASESFLQLEIIRLSELHASTREGLAEAELALGEHASVIPDLNHLVESDPLRERRWELLALALYRAGRQAHALRTVAKARSVLIEELGIEPGPALRQLEDDMLAQSPTLEWQPRPRQEPLEPVTGAEVSSAEPSPPVSPERLLVGREGELAQLVSAFDAARARRGGIALLAGEPGIGKTRLAEELSDVAAREGALVAWGRCHEAEAAPAFWPWVQIVRTLATQVEPELVRAAAGSGATHIAQIVPDIKDLMGSQLAPLPLLDAETARARLYDAISAFVHRLSDARPLVLVFDDLHWADVASLELLQVVCAAVRTASALILCTYRDLEAGTSHPVTATLAVLGRQAHVTRIQPSLLGDDDVRRLVEAQSGTVPDEGVVEIIRARTEGNPFFVSELARLLSSQKQLEASWDDVVGRSIPAGVRDTIRLRLSRLPEQAVTLLGVAAVTGQDFDVDTVAVAADLDEERVLELLEAAVLVGVLVETRALVAYRFSHGLIRETLYDELSSLQRARLHRRVGEALEALHPDDPPLTELAYHFRLAARVGTTEKAVAYALRLSEQATAGLAFELAQEQLQHAADLLEQMPASRERSKRQLDVHIRLGNLLNMTRGYGSPEVAKAWSRAGELSREVEDPAAVAVALVGVASIALLRGDIRSALDAGRLPWEVGAPTGEPALLVGANWILGDVAFMEGQLEQARDHLAAAVELADSLPADVLAAFPHSPAISSRNIHALVLWLIGDADASGKASEEALERARLAHPVSLVDTLFFAGFLGAFVGNPSAVLAAAEEALPLAQALGFPLYDASISILRGWARAARGAPEVGIAEMEAGLRGTRESGTKMFGHVFTGLLADAALRAQLFDTALGAVDKGLTEVEATGERFWEAELHRLRAEALAATGHLAAASESLAQALSVAQAQGAGSLEARVLESMQRVRRAQGWTAP